MPLVSVIIPTYNRGLYLPDAVDSVLRQTFQDFEVIVVDDGSTDGTAAVMRRYGNDSRVRYFCKENGGCASARNFGLKQVQGEFIEHLDSDDVLLENDLELKVDALQSLPDDVAGVFSDYYRSLKPGEVAPKTYFENFDFIDSIRPLVEQCLPELHLYVLNRKLYERHLLQCLITPTLLVRKVVYDDVGAYNESLSSGQDWEFFTRLTKHYRIACLDIPTGKVNFWIQGNVSHPIRQIGNKLQILKGFRREESNILLRGQLRQAIAQAYFRRGLAYYKQRNRMRGGVDVVFAIKNGADLVKSAGLLFVCLVPECVAPFLKKANPYRGRPID